MNLRSLLVAASAFLSFQTSVHGGADFQVHGQDLRTCAWVIGMNPRFALPQDIDDMKDLLSRKDISILSTVPYPSEPGEIVVAAFLYKTYSDKVEADKNLDIIIDELLQLDAKGVEVTCDPGHIDPRLGTGN